MESFAATFWVIVGAGVYVFGLYAWLYTFYRLGGWLRHLADEAAAAKRHEKFQACHAQRAQQDSVTAPTVGAFCHGMRGAVQGRTKKV